MDARISDIKNFCTVTRTPTEEERKKNQQWINHYTQAKRKTELTRLRNDLKTEYLDKHPEYISNPKFKLAASWCPLLASVAGVRTNQEYAKKAREIIGFTLMHIDNYESTHYMVLNCMEKLLQLYNTYSSDKVSKLVAGAFKTILNVTLPIEKTEFDKIKLTLSQELSVKDQEPNFDLSDNTILSLSILSPVEYRQAQLTWKEVVYGSGPPRPIA